jgi:hypothetical protein
MTTINPIGNGLSGTTGTGNFVGANTPTLITPVLGAATATSINFGGSSLSNYVAETNWTPTFSFLSPGNLSVVYATQTGVYVRIGAAVYYAFTLVATPTFTTASSLAFINGLPINAGTTTGYIGSCLSNAITFTGYLGLQNAGGTGYMYIYQSLSSAGSGFLATTNFTSGVQFTVVGSGFYFV